MSGIVYIVLAVALFFGAVFMDEGVLKTHWIYPFCQRLGIAQAFVRVLRLVF